MDALELLRDAYIQDVIDIECFERFVGEIVAERLVALPAGVVALQRGGPPHTANLSSVLREAWTS